MKELKIVKAHTGQCPLETADGCIGCGHFCGIKQTIDGDFAVLCGATDSKKGGARQ